MRYPTVFFFPLAGVFQLRVQAFALSLTFASFFSSSPVPQQIELSHGANTDPLQVAARNVSVLIPWSSPATSMEESLLASPYAPYSSDTTTYKVVPRHFISLTPRGTRTSAPLNKNGEHVFVVDKTFGHIPLRIEHSIALQFYGFPVVLTALFLVYFFSSPQGIARTIESFCDGWWGLLSDIEYLAFCICKWLLWTSWTRLTQIDRSLEALLAFSFELIDETVSRVKIYIKEWEIRQWERESLECIGRKRPQRRTAVLRAFGQHSVNPLFQRERHGSLTYLFLPEEEICPVRHMYDPRYFNKVKTIGAGAFGYIYQVEHRITGKMMAMKVLLRKDNSSDDIDLEVRAMVRVQGEPWYPRLLSTFMDMENFYILMPFYARGDLCTFMTSCGGCLHRDLARFYLAELLLAIQCIHKMGIVHRDLKPENILFEGDGHLIVADFGVAYIFPSEEDDAFFDDEYPLWDEKKALGGDEFPLLQPSVDNPHMVRGVAGTPYYAAPEVIEGRAYSYGVDYYSLAMLYHEMVTGFIPLQCGPFQPGTTEPKLLLDFGRKDVHCQPMSLTDMRFMEKMLDKDLYSRPTVKQMKAHPVFAGIDWMKFSRREVPVPPSLAIRKRVPISHSVDRCLTDSCRGQPEAI
ncbi:hypothetical protein GALMADRAFT_137654 [Galerina marginata CBS 339.88]|uniref:non-specific serine/threonine protein kinase n=1 Tax=Galerina marginata (strain CBS 339.88) TaxID=685588 RepID=A0A067TFE1_GALM3|nr:hypothetical protein GALMADRAFT_137654 [Galerina marginata CBS 339.88]